MHFGLNIGSGQRKFTSTPDLHWLNIDSISREGCVPDVIADGAHLEKICASGTADFVVLHHVLEHFGCGEGSQLILEAFRVLRPGGSLLVFVPDMRALAERWLRGQMDTQLYMTNVYGAYMSHEEDRHKWGYDGQALANFLGDATGGRWDRMGFFNWRAIPGADIARDDRWILGVECVK